MTNYAGILMTGANAGVWYLQQLVHQARVLWGEDYVPPIKTLSVPFESINALLPARMDDAADKMLPYFHEMESQGIEKYILANITLHEAYDKIKGQIPNDHMLHLREIIRQTFYGKKKKIMIIGSLYTMNSLYLPSLFDPGTVQLIKVNKTLQLQVDKLRKVFYKRDDHKMAKVVFKNLTEAHPEVDAFVIACTEHALAIENLPDKSRFVSLPHLQIEYLLKSINHE